MTGLPSSRAWVAGDLGSLGTSAVDSNGASTGTITVTQAVAVGNLVVVAINEAGTSPTVSSVTDTRGNAYAAAGSATGNGLLCRLFASVIASGKALQVNDTITVNYSGTSAVAQILIANAFSNNLTSNPVDGTVGTTHTSATAVATGNTGALAAQGDLGVGAVAWASGSGSMTPTAPFVASAAGTIRAPTAALSAVMCVNTTSIYGANASMAGTLAPAAVWAASLGTYKMITGGPPVQASQALQTASTRL